VDIDVLANDSDGDGYTLSVVSVSDELLGVAILSGGGVSFQPNPGASGVGGFTYTISDGQGGFASASVTVTIEPDVAGPALIASNLVDGDLLNGEEAFGASGVLKPASFDFDDPLLDRDAVSVTLTWNGTPLIEDQDYFVDRTQPARISIDVVRSALSPSPNDGAVLDFALDTIVDSHGFSGDPVAVAVLVDDRPPCASAEQDDSVFQRVVLRFDETMDSSDAAATDGFALHDDTDDVALDVEPDDDPYRGHGWASLDRTDDTFFFVAADPAPEDHSISYDASALTDLAGNPAACAVLGSSVVSRRGQSLSFSELRFVPAGQSGPAVLTVSAAELSAGALLLGNVIDGQDYDLLVQLDTPLSALDDVRLRERAPGHFGADVGGTLETTSVAGDTVRFSPSTDSPGFTFEGGQHFDLVVQGESASGGRRLEALLAVQMTGTDDTAPTAALVAQRAHPADGSVGLLRPGEPIELGFSADLDYTSLVPASFVLTGPSGDVPVLVRLDDGITSERVLLFRDDGSGQPALLDEGDYTLAITGVADLSDPPELSDQLISFSVASAGLPAPQFLPASSTPADGETRVSYQPFLLLAFDDAMWLPSFSERGPLAGRGFRFEERLAGATGEVGIARKGFGPMRDEPWKRAAAVIAAQSDTSLNLARSYRFTPLALRNADGVLLASAAPIVFTTGTPNAPGDSMRPGLRAVWAEAQSVVGDLLLVPDQPPYVLESRAGFHADLFDPDDAPWTIAVNNLTATTGATVSASAQLPLGLDLTGASADAFFVPGDNALSITVTDAVGLSSQASLALYQFDAATTGAGSTASPVVSDLGGGRYAFSGTVPIADGPRALSATVTVVLVDTTDPPPYPILSVAYTATATATRNPDGSLGFDHTMPADAVLPDVAAPLGYLAATVVDAPSRLGTAGTTSTAVSPPSALFGVAP